MAPSSSRRGLTLIEILVTMGIISLLAGILSPALSAARSRGNAAGCVSHLRSIGQTIHAFGNDHDDYVAAVVRERDFFWNRRERLGWDVETGMWARSPGGPRSLWTCSQSAYPFVGNARALGLDNRPAIVGGVLHRVGPRSWEEPARLVLAYDARDDQDVFPFGPGSNGIASIRDFPQLGDVSDEMDGAWPRKDVREFVPFKPGATGPHEAGAVGVAFADGHAAIDAAWTGSEAVLWSGRRWWVDTVSSFPYRGLK